MDISIQSIDFVLSEPAHRLKGARPDDLPLSAAVWDAADRYGNDSKAVVQALYEALKQLESDSIASRPE
jgi:hypothetical protein